MVAHGDAVNLEVLGHLPEYFVIQAKAAGSVFAVSYADIGTKFAAYSGQKDVEASAPGIAHDVADNKGSNHLA